MSLVRGFKADAERLALEIRAELALGDLEPIDMDSLASHLLIPCWPLRRFLEVSGRPRSCVEVEEIYARVSAFTFFDGWRRAVVYNEEHGPARHRSNMAHEIAHALLQHPPVNGNAGPVAEKANEDEAKWLSGTLMLPAHHARFIATSRMSQADALARFQLSVEMLRYRLNVTGASRMAA